MIARALTIAGSDSGGGAGIQADLKTFAVLGVFGTSAITALTAQNTCAVTGVVEVDPAFVAAQIDAVATDIGVDAAKTGMLANAAIIEAVADRVRRHGIARLVVDPVMVAKSGAPLLRPDAVDALRTRLLPLALVVTPNLPEASALAGGMPIRTEADMLEAARAIGALGPRYVVVKGGHLEESDEAVDLLWDGLRTHRLAAARARTPHTHGTGCIFSAAIAAWLARGADPPAAVAAAKRFVTAAIQGALPLGRGRGPANPLAAADYEGRPEEVS
ncbi:MAG: bifunctional hydroxymethylpyrimidine kinase/phosphomethylpyrimidine kinase [Armatimonadota bacterium]|nr:bifunctional hydroxymethylpyrimidine kinase/phosphomethylpyrimidine kinase [Armatimonadota bacterium]MDR7401773.1 bifunctional hydroxymethylpyrimidine kinase/phosphomethylpyrimidine kinase [Armatimonadota bacterium]MDR7403075.1 bifunctional hydroxymethylpyrimidine kinase/phosphomethylpyrimidine kinase [Armatimonadota bacterium]MDR7436222.1 bifunctional hydroxymethylpyrimidine kinase/phosphomethylpyrimidine kinase [Armatimonadota bacterium]MDR7471397.1 bifunctional hydroxymethylpyrimidine kin